MDNTPINQHLKNMSIKLQMLMFPFEAESTAYCVCNFFGLSTDEYSFPYIVGWSNKSNMKELRKSMDIIKTTSSKIIGDLERQLKGNGLYNYKVVEQTA